MPTSYKTCPRCGLTLASVVNICGRCGNRFVVEAVPVAAPPPPLPEVSAPAPPPPVPTSPRQKPVAVSLALGLGGLGIHGFYLGNNAMGATLAAMTVGGGLLAMICGILAIGGAIPIWTIAIGALPCLTGLTIPLFQAARYGATTPEQFQQRYVVEKRWF